MRYPDGSMVERGDVVWWDEELAVGKIIDVHETEEQCSRMGVDAPGVLICYDGSEADGLFIGYPERAFAVEGIRRLSAGELTQVGNIVEAARLRFPQNPNDVTIGLFRKWVDEREYWYVVRFRNSQALQVVEVDLETLASREVPLKDSGLFYDLKRA